MNTENGFPHLLIQLVRDYTGSSLWEVCPPEYVEYFMQLHAGNGNPATREDESPFAYFEEKYPGWTIYKYIQVHSPEMAHRVIEERYWPL
jgi:hypothetical protein